MLPKGKSLGNHPCIHDKVYYAFGLDFFRGFWIVVASKFMNPHFLVRRIVLFDGCNPS